ncbi:allene oxide synthase 1 [Forsythia ovata]|uniref:Allene oxide synthase 1 n=1 Tax=Forsythia ovata TaxID=205694 RepID=A0ABD1TP68_9LAMI
MKYGIVWIQHCDKNEEMLFYGEPNSLSSHAARSLAKGISSDNEAGVWKHKFIDPRISSYARAKRDFAIKSHDVALQIKKGKLLFGFQPFATKDSKIFDQADEFLLERFIGNECEKLLKHVLWSNGPEMESLTFNNKQCARKDFVKLVSRLIELFLHYDSIDVEVGGHL